MAIQTGDLPIEFVAQICDVFAGHWVYVHKNEDGSSHIVYYDNEEHLLRDLMKRYVIREEEKQEAAKATKQ